MSKKKVVIVGPAYPYRGGQALVEAYLHSSLTNLEYDVQTISYKLLYPSIFFPGTTQFEQSEFIPFEHNDKIERRLNSINPFNWLKTAKHINSLKPDILIIVWWMPFFGPALSTIARSVKKKSKSKIVFLIENYVSHEKRWFDKFMTKYTLKYADHFIAQSKYTGKQVVPDFPNAKVHQTTLSVFDCYDFHQYDKPSAREFLNIKESKVILFFGLIRQYKGLDKLIVAFKKVLQEVSDIRLMIVGEAYDKIEKYTDLIKSEDLDSQITLVNQYIPNEKIEPYYKAADFVCLPYNSATQSGIVMMAYGFRRPVIVTDVGGLPELVIENETGFVLENNEPALLANGIIKAYDSDSVDFESNIENYVHQLGYVNMKAIFDEVEQ